MPTILFGLAAALTWGTSDFLGGRFTRKYPAFTVLLVSHTTGFLLVLLLVLIVRPEVHAEAVRWGLAAGLITSFGGLALYQGLATGDAGVVATLSGCGAVVPVIVAFAIGETPTTLQTTGIALALLGGVLASVPASGVHFASASHLKPVLLGLAAAAGFGLFFVLVDRGSKTDADALVVLVMARAGAVVFVGMAGLAARGLRWPGKDLPRLGAVGVIDISANGSFALATARGNVAVASVLASLYPLQTLVLSRFFHAERFTWVRLAGVALALAGVAAISAG
jgi:drug/metabolite transporter (DMT)-like permease